MRKVVFLGILAVEPGLVVVVALAAEGAHVDAAAGRHLVHVVDQVGGAVAEPVAADLLAIAQRPPAAPQGFVGQRLRLRPFVVLLGVVRLGGEVVVGAGVVHAKSAPSRLLRAEGLPRSRYLVGTGTSRSEERRVG